ncbi:CENP-Q, a CENPA-CAD centromere complex subunit-domain-containing protein, partial [Achaetomium macrosporum]
PGEPNQKRKRGRPPAAPKSSTTNATEPNREQTGNDEYNGPSAAPKRRGRPRKSIDTGAQDEPRPAQVEAERASPAAVTAPKKRGRPPVARDTEPKETDTVQLPPKKRRKADGAPRANNEGEESERSKSSKSGETSASGSQQAAESGEQGKAETSSRRGKNDSQLDNSPAEPAAKGPKTSKGREDRSKGKPGRKPTTTVGHVAEEDQTAEDQPVRRSRTDRRSADDNLPSATNQESPDAASGGKEALGPPQRRKRGRPSLAELSAREAQNKAGPSQIEIQVQKKGRGRPPVASDEGNAALQNTQAPSAAKPAKPSRQQAVSPSSATEPATRRGRRRSAEPTSPDVKQAAGPPTKYRHLTARTRQIPRSTISSKWAPLDTPAITAIDSILADATRPVLHRLRDRDQRYAQAQTILRMFTSRLRAKLVKGMPFPPPAISSSTASSRGKKGGEGGHAAELDFESTVDAIARLEKALDPLLHSLVLLRGEKEREERALEREYKLLRRLEANARAQVRGWREGRGREHVLVAGVRGLEEGGKAEGRGLEIVKGISGGGGGVFKDLEEEELLALSRQIGNHMESMRSNLGQIENVLPAIAKSRAALQGTLCEHLDPEQYEQVLLG